MIEAAAARAGKSNTKLRVLVLKNLGWAALIFALLEIWRPFYFLTDDNLDGGFPLLTDMGRRMVRGESPFFSNYIFGGNYDLLRDCTSFVWHPVYLLAAFLATTPAHFLLIDFVAFFFLMLAASGFTCLAHFLREEFDLSLTDGRLTFYTLSFTYGMIVLCAGSSWVNFLGNHSALPWLALGILQTSWRRGIGMVALFSIHHLLGGHLAATISDTLFLTLFAAGIACFRRSLLPLVSWVAGYGIALLILSVVIFSATKGFLDADRMRGFGPVQMTRFAMPAILFPFSYFFATCSSLLPVDFKFGSCPVCYSSAFVSCAAAWTLIPALVSRTKWRGMEILCLGLVLFASLLVIRPLWVSDVMSHIPLLKSMRWPFREILQLQFFLHVFFVLRPLGGSLVFQRLTTFTGILVFLVPLPFIAAPTFNLMQVDRDLLFSGRAERYWTQVKTLLAPGDVILPAADPMLLRSDPLHTPYSLICAYNYPMLFQVVSGTGYSVTVPRDQLYVQTHPATFSGIFPVNQEGAILKERPNIRFVTLESIDPLKVSLSSKSGPPIDLTPLIPVK